MTSIDDFKKIAKEAFDTLTDVSVEAYKLAEEKAKIVGKWTKLNTEITLDRSQVRRLRSEVGKIYYETYKDDPAEPLKELCENITAALDRIAAKQKELDDLKNSGGFNDADFEEFSSDDDEEDDEN